MKKIKSWLKKSRVFLSVLAIGLILFTVAQIVAQLAPFLTYRLLSSGITPFYPSVKLKGTASPRGVSSAPPEKMSRSLDSLSLKVFHLDMFAMPVPTDLFNTDLRAQLVVRGSKKQVGPPVDLQWSIYQQREEIITVSPLLLKSINVFHRLPSFFSLPIVEASLLSYTKNQLVRGILKVDLAQRPSSWKQMVFFLWCQFKRAELLFGNDSSLFDHESELTEIQSSATESGYRYSILLGQRAGLMFGIGVRWLEQSDLARSLKNYLAKTASYTSSDERNYYQMSWEAAQMPIKAQALGEYTMMSMGAFSHLRWPIDPIEWLNWKSEARRRGVPESWLEQQALNSAILKNAPFQTLAEYQRFLEKEQTESNKAKVQQKFQKQKKKRLELLKGPLKKSKRNAPRRIR